MSLIELAYKLRPIIVQAMQGMDDKISSEVPMLFDNMKYTGELIKSGTKINWGGIVKKARVDLWDASENAPDAAPELWVDLKYKDGIRIIPGKIETSEAFSKGEIGWWDDKAYESIVDGNVFTPAEYINNWKEAML